MKQITKVRKVVCIMANELKKLGYSLSQAFKKAWAQVKNTMKVRAAGTTFENRQERLQFLKQFHLSDLTVRVLLQHSSAATTQRYIGLQRREIEEALQKHIKLL